LVWAFASGIACAFLSPSRLGDLLAPFFARAWAKFDEAVPGTLRLVPPENRVAELERDYRAMRDEMIFGDAPTLGHIIDVLREIERRVNGN